MIWSLAHTLQGERRFNAQSHLNRGTARGGPDVDYDWTQVNFRPTGRPNRISQP